MVIKKRYEVRLCQGSKNQLIGSIKNFFKDSENLKAGDTLILTEGTFKVTRGEGK